MRSIKDFKKILSINKDRIFNEYSIKSMAIFGSFSREEENEKSDLDILVEFDGKIGIRFIDLAEELENLLKIKVDLVSKKGLKDKYLSSISSDLLYV
jgi:uncharacterized protein